jgi:hypothetical protein
MRRLLLFNFRFLLFFFVVLALFSSLSFAVLKSESAILDVSLELPISFVVSDSYVFSYLDVDFVMVPSNDYRQSLISSKYNLEPFSSNSNSVKFRLVDTRDTVIRANYFVETEADSVKVFDKVNFPIKSLDPSFLEFISRTDVYDYNGDISNLALSLSSGEDDLFNVVFNLASWVNSNVEYDLGTLSSDVLPASWVFENRRGVCTEYTSLFVALARSLGIPAREVSGFAFTESDLFERGWEFHSWAEVYFPGFGWVLFDPTYGQYGFVDAGHVKLGSSEGELVKNSFSWRGRGVDVLPGQTDLSVRVVSTSGSRSSGLSFENFFLEDVVGSGSYNFLRVDVSNNNPFYVSDTIRLAGVDGLSFLSTRFKSFVLGPYETESLYFVFKLRDNLRPNFLYTYPLRYYIGDEVFSADFKASVGSVIVSESDVSFLLDDSNPVFDFLSCNITPIVRVGESVILSCNSLGFEGVLCFDGICEFFDGLTIMSLSVPMNNSGLFTKLVTFKASDFSANSFESLLVLDSASLNLSGTSYIDVLSPSDTGFINVSLKKSSSSVPMNVSLRIVHDYFEEEFFLGDVNDVFVFSFFYPSMNLKKGSNDLLIQVNFTDILGESFSEELLVRVDLVNLSFLDEVELFFRRIYFWFKNLW